MLREFVKKIGKTTLTLGVAAVVFFVAKNVFAQPNLGINALAEGGVQLGQTDIRIIIARIIEVFLGLLGTIAVVLIIYGGWLWMSAAGDAQKITKAKQTLINAVIGLAVILSAFGITQFIVSRLISATTGSFIAESAGAWSQPLSGSLGAGIISGHVPERGARVSRNTKVAITFKEAIDDKTLATSGGDADINVFKMTKTAILKQAGNNFKNVGASDLVAAKVAFTPDKLNFVFAPTALLGSPSEAVSYTVFIAPGLKKVDGSAAFSGAFASGYEWEFQVDPVIDTAPPKILSIIPSAGINPRNSSVQINFSESVDPTSASGDVETGGAGFQNMAMRTGGNVLGGGFKISNGYRTVEFITKDACGTNSCGGTVYCLPADALISGLVKAATVSTEPPQAVGFPYNGVVDMAGNSLDGNGDGAAWGPSSQSGKPAYNWVGGNAAAQGDDASWQFNTSDQVDLVPPKISKIEPGLSAENVAQNVPVKITFDKVMSATTLNNNNLSLTHNVPAPYELWYGVDAEALDAAEQLAVSGVTPVKTRAILQHGLFAPSIDGGAQYNFYPSINSKVQDLRQNCYNPSAGPSCAPTFAAPYCCNGVASAAKCNYVP